MYTYCVCAWMCVFDWVYSEQPVSSISNGGVWTYVWWCWVYRATVAARLHVCAWVNIVVLSCVIVVLCVCWGESRCSGADSSALCILKPPSPPAAKIELGGVGGRVHGWVGSGMWEGGGGGSDIAPQGGPSLSHLLAQFIWLDMTRKTEVEIGRERQREGGEREKERVRDVEYWGLVVMVKLGQTCLPFNHSHLHHIRHLGWWQADWYGLYRLLSERALDSLTLYNVLLAYRQCHTIKTTSFLKTKGHIKKAHKEDFISAAFDAVTGTFHL